MYSTGRLSCLALSECVFCVHRRLWNTWQSFFQVLFIYLFLRPSPEAQVGFKLHMKPRMTLSPWFSFLSPCPRCWGYRHVPPCLVFAMLGNELQTSCLLGQCSLSWATSPAPRVPTFKCVVLDIAHLTKITVFSFRYCYMIFARTSHCWSRITSMDCPLSQFISRIH